jgi:hypothetical protein
MRYRRMNKLSCERRSDWGRRDQAETTGTAKRTVIRRKGPDMKELAFAVLLLVAPAVAQRQDKPIDPNLLVYMIEGGTIFHRQDCDSLTGMKVKAVRYRDLPAHAEECMHCRPLKPPEPIKTEPPPSWDDVSYLIDAPTTVRAAPSATSKVVGRLAPVDVARILEAKLGWLRLEGLGASNLEGWVPAKEENLLAEDWLSVRFRLVEANDAHWPAATKIDIARRKVRVGFTKAQVKAALGKPASEASEETAAGVTEVLAYPGQAVTLKAGRVVKIAIVK